jgi:hypothetical protein
MALPDIKPYPTDPAIVALIEETTRRLKDTYHEWTDNSPTVRQHRANLDTFLSLLHMEKDQKRVPYTVDYNPMTLTMRCSHTRSGRSCCCGSRSV